MKRTISLFGVFIAAQAMVLFAQTVDFDGQSNVRKSVAGYISDASDAAVPAAAAEAPKAGSGAGPADGSDGIPHWTNRIDSLSACQAENIKDDGLLIRREVLTDNGEWVVVNPAINSG